VSSIGLLSAIVAVSVLLFVLKGLSQVEKGTSPGMEVLSPSGVHEVPAPLTNPPPVPNPAPSVSKEPAAAVREPVGEPLAAPAKQPAREPEKAPEPSKPQAITAVPAAPSRTVSAPPERPRTSKGTLLFVFDDAGHNLAQLEPFLNLPFPCTIAVLPRLQYSREAARRVRAAGKELILHQPMQAENLSYDPGPGAITQGMGPDAIRSILRVNLDEVGPVAGMNNHEGSLITADLEAMKAVLSVAEERGIYFLDSRTTAQTAAPEAARQKHMKLWERAVFLDNIQERESFIEAVSSGLKIAEKKGAAIMIGHIWSSELAQTLNEMYPDLVSQGFSLSTIAQLALHEGDE